MNPLKQLGTITTSPFRAIKTTLGTQAHYWRGHITEQRNDISQQRMHNRQSDTPQTLDQMMTAWGLNAQNKNQVMRGLLLEKRLFIILSLVLPMGLWLSHDPFSIALYLIISPCFGLIALTKEWRLTCLRQEHYIGFKHWIQNGCP